VSPSITREELAALRGKIGRAMDAGSRQLGAEVRTSLAGKGRGGGAAHSRKEREIQAAILAFLRTVPGVCAWRNNVGAVKADYKGRTRFIRFGAPGLADIVGWITVSQTDGVHKAGPFIRYARFLAIEVKRPGTWPTNPQTLFLASVQQAGGIAILARSVEDVAIALDLRPTPTPGGAGAR